MANPEETQELLRSYYKETDPQKRKELLESIGDDDELLALRKMLFEKRFGNKTKKDGNYADGYLLVFIEILQTRGETAGLFGRNRQRILKTLAAFGKEEADAYGNEGEEVLHKEIVNAAMRYFQTCMSPTYRRKLFGTMMPSDNERKAFIRKDACNMSYGVSERLGMEEELTYLCRAVAEAYAAFAPDDKPLGMK